MAGIVYLATNRVNGKRYIGVTSRGLPARRRQHEIAPNSKAVTCRYFHAAMRKYGPESFDWSVLISCDSFNAALQEEVRLISEIRPEYNLTAGGQGATGAVFSAERRSKIAAALKGKPKSAEHRLKVSLARRGKKSSPEAIAARVAGHIGKPLSESHRESIRNTLKGRKRPPEVVARFLATRAKTFAARRAEAKNGSL